MIELICIGSEILNGSTLNTNAQFLSNFLFEKGLRVHKTTVVGDDPLSIHSALEEGLKQAQLVIVTGGLGPTKDDITRQVAAKLFDSPCRENPQVREDLQRRFGNIASLEDQCFLPVKARLLQNRIGTAPGLYFQEKGKHLVLLPGVPNQMQAIFTEAFAPYLDTLFSPLDKVHLRHLHLCGLIEDAVDPFLRELQKAHPGAEISICPSYGKVLSIHILGKAREVESIQTQILGEYGTYSFSGGFSGKATLPQALQEVMIDKQLTLGLAESCTGGAMAAYLTAIAGASKYFLGSIVSYSDQLKKRGLHVKSLEEEGAVSEAVVKEMCSSALELMQSDIAIAVSGIAGPDGGSKEKPVGTVWTAIKMRSGAFQTRCLHHKSSDRSTIIASTAMELFGILYRHLQHGVALYE